MMNSSSKEKARTVIPANQRHIRKVAVLDLCHGSRIACHFAHRSERLLLDNVSSTLQKSKIQFKGTKSDCQQCTKAAVKSKPSPIYHAKFLDNITTGNFEDDLDKIASATG